MKEESRKEGRKEGRREGRREGSYTSVQKLVANRAAATEKKACEMLSVDYDAFLKWKNEQSLDIEQ